MSATGLPRRINRLLLIKRNPARKDSGSLYAWNDLNIPFEFKFCFQVPAIINKNLRSNSSRIMCVLKCVIFASVR